MKRLITGAVCALILVSSSFYPVYFPWILRLIILTAAMEGFSMAGLSKIQKAFSTAVFISIYFILIFPDYLKFTGLYFFLSVAGYSLISLNSDERNEVMDKNCTSFFLAVYFSLGAFAEKIYLETDAAMFIFLLSFGWIYDSCAFYFGCMLGKHKICPAVSPKKSWEGFFAGMIGAIAAGGLIGNYYFTVSFFDCACIALFSAVFGHWGDIFESSWKRKYGQKDSSAILPGHGGLWDRIDGFLFFLPALWFLNRVSGIW